MHSTTVQKGLIVLLCLAQVSSSWSMWEQSNSHSLSWPVQVLRVRLPLSSVLQMLRIEALRRFSSNWIACRPNCNATTRSPIRICPSLGSCFKVKEECTSAWLIKAMPGQLASSWEWRLLPKRIHLALFPAYLGICVIDISHESQLPQRIMCSWPWFIFLGEYEKWADHCLSMDAFHILFTLFARCTALLWSQESITARYSAKIYKHQI